VRAGQIREQRPTKEALHSETQPGGLTTTVQVAGSSVTGRGRGPRRCSRPDLWETHYPDPRVNLRTTMFGLTLEQYRAEFMRRRGEGWFEWELSQRFPRPGEVAA
jgi:hypothetical protein